MTTVLAILLRFAHVVIGYAAACLVASAFLHLTFLGSQGFDAEEARWVALGSIYFSIPFVALFVAYYAFLPSVAVISVAEHFGRRDWLTYGLAGAIVGLVVGMLLQSPPLVSGDLAAAELHPTMQVPTFLALNVGSGICGGIAYWLTAGRWAGSWRG